MTTTTERKIEVMRDADPNYWIVVIDGVSVGGFKSEEKAREIGEAMLAMPNLRLIDCDKLPVYIRPLFAKDEDENDTEESQMGVGTNDMTDEECDAFLRENGVVLDRQAVRKERQEKAEIKPALDHSGWIPFFKERGIAVKIEGNTITRVPEAVADALIKAARDFLARYVQDDAPLSIPNHDLARAAAEIVACTYAEGDDVLLTAASEKFDREMAKIPHGLGD